MRKLIKVEKKMLKISAKEHEKLLREDKVSTWLLNQQDREVEKTVKKLKEEK